MYPLKTKLTLLVLVAILLQSFIDPYSKKKITDKEFKYEFYTTSYKTNPKENTAYYWFKGGAIHNAKEGVAGELLDGPFLKFYLNNQLAEQGQFKNGKKIGLWKTWYINGTLSSETHWKSGQMKGKYLSYSELGEAQEQGYYRNNKKQGRWINFLTKDTLTYRADVVVIKKVKVKKGASKKENKTKKEAVKSEVKKEDTPKKATNSKEPKKIKESFFKRLFSKKSTSKNGKSQ